MSWRNSQERELPFNLEARDATWLLVTKSLEQDKPQHLWFSLRCGSLLQNITVGTTVGRKNRKKRNTRRRAAHNRNTKHPLDWHACKKELEEKYTGNGSISAQRGISIFIQEGMQELGLKTTTPSGCALGVKHPRTGKLVGR